MRRVTWCVGVVILPLLGWAQTVQRDSRPNINQHVIDIRDWGVDCTGSTDATTILNKHTGDAVPSFDGREVVIPAGCVLNVGSGGSGWRIRNHQNFRIRFSTSAGSPGTLLAWCGPAAPAEPVLKLENVHTFEIVDPAIDAHKHGCAGPAGRGITIDRVGSGVNTSNGIIRHPMVSSSLQGASHDPNFIGIWASPTSFNNVEDIRVIDPIVNCNSPIGGGGENTVGILFGPSTFNAKEEVVSHLYGGGCMIGTNLGIGGAFITEGDISGNLIDFKWSGAADPMEITRVTSEAAGQFLDANAIGGSGWPLLLQSNHSAGDRHATPNKCDYDLDSAGTIAMHTTLINNGWDAPTVAGHQSVCSNQQSHNVFINNVYGDYPTTGPTRFPFNPRKNYGADYLVIDGGRVRVGAADVGGGNWDTGFGFFGRHGAEIPGLGYMNDSNAASVGGMPQIGRDQEFLGTGQVRVGSVWPIWTDTVSCSVVGTGGSTHWAIKIIPKNASGKKGAWYVNGGNFGCGNAKATLDRNNYLHLSGWPTPSQAASYDIVFMNPLDPQGHGKLMATVKTNSVDIKVQPRAPWDYVFPTYDETGWTEFWGAAADFQAPIHVLNAAGKGWIPAVKNDGSDKVQIGDATHPASAPGGIVVATRDPRPSCDATHRSWFWVSAGGPGVKDTVEVCAKDASDKYAWRALY